MTYSFNIFRRKGYSVKSVSLIQQEGEALGLSVNIFRTGDSGFKGNTLRWGSIGSFVPEGKVYNKAKGIRLTSDKGKFRKLLADSGLAPRVYTTPDLPKDRFPVLIRPDKHSRGDAFFVCNTEEEARDAIAKILEGNSGYYISELIDKKEEYRVFTFKGRVLAVVRKEPTDRSDIFWGCVEGGSFKYVSWGSWNLNLCDVALRSAGLSDLDFCVFDIVEDRLGRFYTLENNTAPELTPYYAKCIAKALLWEAQEKEVPEVGEVSSYHDVIHPAII